MDKDGPSLELDRPSEVGFIKFFESLDAKPDNTLRLFERGQQEYYSAHGDDALFIAQEVYKTSTVIKYLGADEKLPSVTISKVNTENFVRELLLQRQYRVEIWKCEARKSNAWKLYKKASPGNLQDVEDMLFRYSDVSTTPIVLAIKLATKDDQKVVGAAYADATTMRKLGVAEFVDNDVYSNLESLIIQLSAKECVVPEDPGNYELNKIKKLLNRLDIVITEKKKADFGIKDIEQDLNRLLGEEISVASLSEYDMKNAMGATACLIKYLGLLHDDANFGQYIMETHDLNQFMRLDASAVKALNLMPGPQDGNKTMSLYGLLNHCKTAQGSRLLGQWLRQPLLCLPDIEARLNLVEALVSDTQLRQSLQNENLKSFPDLNRLAKRFQKGSAGLQDVIRVYQCVIKLPDLKEALENFEGEKFELKTLLRDTYLTKLESYMTDLDKLKDLVESTIDLEALDDHEFLVKADFDEDLQAMKVRMEEIHSAIEPEARRVARELDMELGKKLKLEQSSQYGHYLRLSRNDSSAIRGQKQYRELACQKSGVFFQTSTLRELSEEYRELKENYEQMQSNLAKEIVKITAGYFPVLELLNQLIAHLDVITSFAHVSIHAPTPYARPTLSKMGEGNFVCKDARHPCIEVQDDVSFIPNDVEMLREASTFHIITGPNMGGKSTYIRQIGVIALMAQVGCFVPCTEASVPLFDSILARVGAGDSQLKGVSTFMSEMLETATILRNGTSNSLIIIDELGRGTSTYDGFGLAWAISEYIAKHLHSFSLFATHFHELTTLSNEIPTVKNFHVTAYTDEQAITLLYKVSPGVCDQSFGIHVAEIARFPDSVVKVAKRKASELEDFEQTGSTSVMMDVDGTINDENKKVKLWNSSDAEIDAGNRVIEAFFKELKTIKGSVDGMQDGEVIESVKGLLEEFKPEMEGSAFVKEVLMSF